MTFSLAVVAALPVNWLLIGVVAAVLVFLALAAVVRARAKGGEGGDGPIPVDVYEAKASLFTPAERSFLGVLHAAMPEGVDLASKVRLADVVTVRAGCDRRTWQRAFNRIAAKHVDFLIVGKADGRPLLAIELDDASHNRDDRRARDDFVETVFSSAGLPLLRIPARASYDSREVGRQIAGRLNGA